MPPRRIGRASRQVVGGSRALVSAKGEDFPQPSAPVRRRDSQYSVILSFASAINRAVDFVESLAIRQLRVQQSAGQRIDYVLSGNSSSQPFVAPPSLGLQRFRRRGRQFKRYSSSSSRQPCPPFQSQRSRVQFLDASKFRELSLSREPRILHTRVDAQADVMSGGVLLVVVLSLITLREFS
ncbi:hypothetical protein F511_19311 [Dorcoceras hygrometricum]|uniref:Uncharacterized protein n=1 Tax=Dorcoceras hygrometricum TaxID=472368 RepID=A0A2Z7AR70_9LAMI|nr:hypothetical protein F511_19311 [Dorcoceras hygrometricum]